MENLNSFNPLNAVNAAGGDDMTPSGTFISKTANQWCAEAAARKDPRPLWHSLWFENEVACLFADTNVGKSIYAVDIADHITRNLGKRVLYFDFEMSDKQFQMRYSDEAGSLYRFSPLLTRVELNAPGVGDNVAFMAREILLMTLAERADVVIIDNITWLCNRSESGDAAGELMQQLVSLKRDHGLSVLVLAHTPKRAMSSRLTQNSLAGSKRIANFMDSIFAIGKAPRLGREWRYIKQIKTRSAEMTYDAENVIVACLAREGSRLTLAHLDFDREDNLIGLDDKNGSGGGGISDERRNQVLDLHAQGKSQNEIARELKIGKLSVNRIIREYREQ